MSVDYYARLEQRRGPQPSVQMLSALARTLRLGPDERDHLYRVAGHPAPERTGSSTYVRPALIHVLDQLDAAFVCSDLEVMLAQNRLSVLLMGDRRPRGAGILATADEGPLLVILSAPPASESYGKLKLLGVLGDQEVGASAGHGNHPADRRGQRP
jgi:hypothetical protein